MMYVIPLVKPFDIGYGIVVFRQRLPSGGLVSTNKVKTKTMSRTRKHKLTGAKRHSGQCRNHGACEWCRRNRTYNELRDKEKASYDEKEFENQ